MKSINHTSVFKGYFLFSVCMALVVALFVFMNYCFVSATRSEDSRIGTRSVVFDQTFDRQNQFVDRVDSLYNYMTLINSSCRVNDILVQNTVSTRKMQLLEDMKQLDGKDVLLYQNLMGRVNMLLAVKDSIRILKSREQTLKEDLQRCIAADRQATRKLSLESVQSAKTNANGN